MYTGADDLHKDTECPDVFDLPSTTGKIKIDFQKAPERDMFTSLCFYCLSDLSK